MDLEVVTTNSSGVYGLKTFHLNVKEEPPQAGIDRVACFHGYQVMVC